MALLRHALRPAQPTALLLIATLTLLLSIASLAGLPGLPLKVIVLSWLFKYAYVLLDLSSEGVVEPPVLSAEMVNPVEQRPLMQLAICGAGFGLAWWIGGVPGYALGAAFLVLLPATAAVLGVTGSAIEALNPLTLARVMRGLGSAYLVLLAATIAFAAAICGLEHLPVWGVVKTAAAQWLLLSLFSLVGGAIYERREALGHEPQVSPERAAEREERERVRRREHMLDDAYVPARIHESQRVVEPLRRWLDAAGGAQLEADARVPGARGELERPGCLRTRRAARDRAACRRAQVCAGTRVLRGRKTRGARSSDGEPGGLAGADPARACNRSCAARRASCGGGRQTLSRAFVKEGDGEAVLPERAVSLHPNFVTANGLAQIEERVRALEAARAERRAKQRATARLLRMLRRSPRSSVTCGTGRSARRARDWSRRRPIRRSCVSVSQ